MQEVKSIESPSAGDEIRMPERGLFRDSFEAALRVNKHHAHKFESRLRVLQQQRSRASDSGSRDGAN